MKKLKSKKKIHILKDKKWHHYIFVYNKGKTILYVDGKAYKGDCPMTYEMHFKGMKGIKTNSMCDEIRVSKCERRKI